MINLVTDTLKTYRESHNLSCYALAKQVGITSGQLKALESGRDTPSLSTLQAFARFFGWSKVAIGRYVLECSPDRAGPKRIREEVT